MILNMVEDFTVYIEHKSWYQIGGRFFIDIPSIIGPQKSKIDQADKYILSCFCSYWTLPKFVFVFILKWQKQVFLF